MTIEISKLSNGLTVITDPMANLESAALGVWVSTGSRNELPPEMGLSHMLEHMAFKGTATRSARQIAEEIEAVGGYLNAYTSREQTAFHARVLKNDVALALDLVADILVNSTFVAEELERERQVVLQELGQARDTPDDIIFDHLQNVIYKDQPLGWAILGEEATVAAFTPGALRDYSGRRYRADAMTLVSSGAVSHGQIVALAEEKFARLGTGEKEAGELSAVIAGEMEAMTAGVSDAELARAKAQLKSGLLMGLERPGTRAEQIAGQIFTFGHLQSTAEIVAQIDAVDAAALKRYAGRIMSQPSMAAMGPIKKLERHDIFAARFARGREAAE